MSTASRYTKSNFANLFLATAETTSCDHEEAKHYLASRGLNPEDILKEGQKRLKLIRLKAEAFKTTEEMKLNNEAKAKAAEWVESLLSNIEFSFIDFVKEENLVLQNRNLESLSPEDVKNTMINFFYLKFLKNKNI